MYFKQVFFLIKPASRISDIYDAGMRWTALQVVNNLPETNSKENSN
jgi:hypothetical protein